MLMDLVKVVTILNPIHNNFKKLYTIQLRIPKILYYIYIYFIRNFYHPSDPSPCSPFLEENGFTFFFLILFCQTQIMYISKTQKNILYSNEWNTPNLELEMRNRDGFYVFIGYIL